MIMMMISKERGNNALVLLLLWCSCVGVARCEVQGPGGSVVVTPTPATHVMAVPSAGRPVGEAGGGGGPQAFPNPENANLPVFTMDYPRVQVPFEFTLWILLASFAKIGFHVYDKITIWIPESCLLISIGLVVGGIMHAVKEEPPAMLDSNVFFLYMLPLIVLENGYFMPTRAFFENIGTVVWYAVVGTLWNSVGIGLSLWAICQVEAFGVQDINLQENLLFASIIAAVDPVAALSVFEDVGVNEQLYIVIFGEGLFNDAVTVVLYNMFIFVARMPTVESPDVFLGVARFFVVGVGGVAFGFLFGFLAAFTTRFTGNVRQIEPLFVFLYSYLAYLVAELFAISSIMAIVVCAITMKYYVEENVAQRSCTTIRHVVKMLASISETLVFFFLGVVTVTTEHEWNWAYILFTLLFAFVWRFLGVLVLTQIVNPFKTISFTYHDQFGLAYGGLRGAICFALAFTLPSTINRRELFVTASIAVIIFTVFIQGISLRPIIEYMNIRRTNKEMPSINMEIHNRLIEHTISGIEDLCGQWSHYYWKDKFKKFNDTVLRFILLRDRKHESSIVALYKKLELQSAIDLLDTTVGDISAAPSVVNLHDEKKDKARPKNTFMAADIKKMHHILANNMYNIRQKTVAYSTRHNLPDNSKAREILIRRHPSIRRSLRAGSARDLQTRAPSRSQKYYSLQPGGDLESAFPLRRLSSNVSSNGRADDADEVDRRSEPPTRLRPGAGPPRSTSAHSSGRSLQASTAARRLSVVNEGAHVAVTDPGGGAAAAALGRYKAPVPAPRRRLSDRSVGRGDETGGGGGGDEAVGPPPLPPPISSVWAQADRLREPVDSGAGDPLLLIRHSSSSSSQGSRRSSVHPRP